MARNTLKCIFWDKSFYLIFLLSMILRQWFSNRWLLKTERIKEEKHRRIIQRKKQTRIYLQDYFCYREEDYLDVIVEKIVKTLDNFANLPR